jgi:hypothetical protein
MSIWYSEISRDLSALPACIDYFYKEMGEAKLEIKLSGILEKQAALLPGVVENRFNQLQEIEAILEYLNIELRKIRSRTFKKFLENYQRALSSRDVEKYVDGEDEIVNMEKLINEFALIRNQWLGLIKALEVKGFQINNIIKLRTSGFDDASI